MARITQSPLPQLESSAIQKLERSAHSDHYRAYASVLQAEASEVDPAKLVSIRVAGFLLLEFVAQSGFPGFLGFQPSATLVKWFTSPPQSCSNNQHDIIVDSGTLLRDKFIRMFRTTTTSYSQPSSHPSRPSFDTLEDMIKDSMEASGKDYKTFKNKALGRDGHRCVVTGIFNKGSFGRLGAQGIVGLPLETAHIFNESTMRDIDPAVREDIPSKSLNKTRTTAGALAILESFGFSKFTDAFRKAGGVHQVWNLLTLQHDLHHLFDNLELWFEHTKKPHRYKVCTLSEGYEDFIRRNFEGNDRNIEGAPMFVEFNEDFTQCGAPPPEPLLLAIHATCARVAHMSGAAEFFDQIERDTEEISVLALDGSSAPLLSYLLSPYAVISGVA